MLVVDTHTRTESLVYREWQIRPEGARKSPRCVGRTTLALGPPRTATVLTAAGTLSVLSSDPVKKRLSSTARVLS